MAYFKAHPDSGVTRPDQIAIVGDRLSTDIMMANMMGSYGFWIKDGAVRPGFVSQLCCSEFPADNVKLARMEDRLQSFLLRRGYAAPDPSRNNQFEQ